MPPHQLGEIKLNTSYQSLRTIDLPARHRLTRWNAFISNTFAAMDVTPHDPPNFNGSLSRMQIGNIGLTWLEMTAATVNVGGGQVSPWSAPIGDAFMLSLQEKGTCVGHHLGREIITNPGDVVLLDATLLPWHFVSQGPMSTIIIKLPADRVLGMVNDAEAVCGMRFSAEAPKVALASSMLVSIKSAIEANPDEDWNGVYEDLLLDIVATIISEMPKGDTAPKGTSLRRRACAIIEQRLDDPALDVSYIATTLGTSTRTIQRLFLEIGFTPRSYILERRIAAAAEKIRRGDGGSSITDVALSLGFNDLSHFTHSFRKKMGMSPSEYRAGKKSPAPAIKLEPSISLAPDASSTVPGPSHTP